MMDFDEVRTILSPKSESLDEKLSIFREDRDTWNSKVKKYLTERNEINRQVKELITEVQNQKVIRDEANSKVKELKIMRRSPDEFVVLALWLYICANEWQCQLCCGCCALIFIYYSNGNLMNTCVYVELLESVCSSCFSYTIRRVI